MGIIYMTEEEMNDLVIFDASKQSENDNNKQADSEGDMSKPVRDFLDEESELN